MKKPIPYILAFLVGLFSRTAISALNGWEYSMNGIDLLCGLTCIVMVWSFKGAFLPKKKTAAERQFSKRQKKN